MSRDGSGTYNLSANAIVVAHAQLNSTYFNATLVDIASALTQSISKDGQTTATGNLPMGTYRHTNVGAASARTDYARTAEVQDNSCHWGGTAGGTATALTISVSPAIAAYVAGQMFFFKASLNSSASATTIAINGLAAKTINERSWSATDVVQIVYDGTAFFQPRPR